MKDVYLSLGTNLGDRHAYISCCLDILRAELGEIETSEIIETEAVGFEAPAFLNCVLKCTYDKGPFSLLKLCKGVERSMGRTDGPEYDADGNRIYHDRIIDVDILRYGDLEMRTEELTIPHHALSERLFFEELMASIDQDKA